MESIIDIPEHVVALQREATSAERRAAAFVAALPDLLEARGFPEEAALCRSVCARHERAIEWLRQSALAWERLPEAEPRSREFVLRVASPRHLVEVALELEREAFCCHEVAWDGMDEPVLRAQFERLLVMARDNVGTLVQVRSRLPEAVDWEQLIAAGTVPSLALGAERRLRRSH